MRGFNHTARLLSSRTRPHRRHFPACVLLHVQHARAAAEPRWEDPCFFPDLRKTLPLNFREVGSLRHRLNSLVTIAGLSIHTFGADGESQMTALTLAGRTTMWFPARSRRPSATAGRSQRSSNSSSRRVRRANLSTHCSSRGYRCTIE